jgi:hypothetical protein
MEHNMTLLEPVHGQLLLCKEEGWKALASTGLLAAKQVDKEKLECITPHPIHH